MKFTVVRLTAACLLVAGCGKNDDVAKNDVVESQPSSIEQQIATKQTNLSSAEHSASQVQNSEQQTVSNKANNRNAEQPNPELEKILREIRKAETTWVIIKQERRGQTDPIPSRLQGEYASRSDCELAATRLIDPSASQVHKIPIQLRYEDKTVFLLCLTQAVSRKLPQAELGGLPQAETNWTIFPFR